MTGSIFLPLRIRVLFFWFENLSWMLENLPDQDKNSISDIMELVLSTHLTESTSVSPWLLTTNIL